MEDWAPISRGRVYVPDEQPTNGLIAAYTDLSRTPEPEWLEAFLAPSGVSQHLDGHVPEVDGSRVTIEVLDPDKLSEVVSYVDGAIGWANHWYQGTILPLLRSEAEARAQRAEHRQSELEKARRIAEDL